MVQLSRSNNLGLAYVSLVILTLSSHIYFTQAKSASLSLLPKLGEGRRASIMPDLPNEIKFDGESFKYNRDEGTTRYYFTLQENLTLTGLANLEDELTYNSVSNRLELAIHIPYWELQGTFSLEGYSLYCPWGCQTTYLVSVNGTLKVKHAVSRRKSNVIIANGVVRQELSAVAFESFEVEQGYAVFITDVQGTIGNQSSAERYLDDHFGVNITQSVANHMKTYIDRAFEGMTMQQLLNLTDNGQ